jgi:hypothetical protein
MIMVQWLPVEIAGKKQPSGPLDDFHHLLLRWDELCIDVGEQLGISTGGYEVVNESRQLMPVFSGELNGESACFGILVVVLLWGTHNFPSFAERLEIGQSFR